MIFEIAEDIIRQYPKLRIGVVVAEGIDNQGRNPELDALADEVVTEFRRRYSADGLNAHPNIVGWRNTYRSFGVNPKKHQPTHERFCESMLDGNRRFPWISRAVNAYLLTELEFLLPVGGYDMDLISGVIELRRSPGGEEFIPLATGNPAIRKPKKTQPGEIIYSDTAKVLTESWNRHDSDLSKITESSTGIALFSEAADESIRTDDVIGISERIKEYLVRFCGGKARAFLVEAGQQTRWELDAAA